MSELSQALAELPLTAECKFIEFKPEFSAEGKNKTIESYERGQYHWTVTLRLNGKSVTTRYSTGTGHCIEPGESHSYTYRGVSGFSRAPKNWRSDHSGDAVAFRKYWFADKRSARAPDLADVVSCLFADASGAEESFEDWCASLGCDTDSRRAHDTWQACRNTALDLRVLFGNDYDRLSRLEH